MIKYSKLHYQDYSVVKKTDIKIQLPFIYLLIHLTLNLPAVYQENQNVPLV